MLQKDHQPHPSRRPPCPCARGSRRGRSLPRRLRRLTLHRRPQPPPLAGLPKAAPQQHEQLSQGGQRGGPLPIAMTSRATRAFTTRSTRRRRRAQATPRHCSLWSTCSIATAAWSTASRLQQMRPWTHTATTPAHLLPRARAPLATRASTTHSTRRRRRAQASPHHCCLWSTCNIATAAWDPASRLQQMRPRARAATTPARLLPRARGARSEPAPPSSPVKARKRPMCFGCNLMVSMVVPPLLPLSTNTPLHLSSLHKHTSLSPTLLVSHRKS